MPAKKQRLGRSQHWINSAAAVFIALILSSLPARAQSPAVIFACPFSNSNARTTLSIAVNAATPTIVTPLMNSYWPTGTFVIAIDAEQMHALVRVDTTVTTLTVTRGYNGTTPAAHAQGVAVVIVCDTITGIANSLPVNNVGQQGHLLEVAATSAVADVNGLQIRIEASADCPDQPPTGTCAGGHWFPISDDIVTLKYTTAATPPQAYALVKANGTFNYVRVASLTNSPGGIPLSIHYSGAPFPIGNINLVCPTPLSCIFIINPGGGGGEHVITFIINSVGGSIPTALTGSGTIDFPSINDGACADGTFPVVGAVAGDKIAPGWPVIVSAATGMFGTMSVSAGGTVQARMCNLSGAPVDLASATYSATDIQGGGGGGGTIALGDVGLYPSIEDFSCAITSCTISANTSCAAAVSINKKNAAIPSGADKISGTSPVTLAGPQQLNQAACNLANWSTTSVVPGDVFGANVDSVSGCSTVMVQLWCQ